MFHLNDEQHEDFQALKEKSPLMLPINEEGATKLFHLHKAQSVPQSKILQTVFHLHPEFVFLSEKQRNDSFLSKVATTGSNNHKRNKNKQSEIYG